MGKEGWGKKGGDEEGGVGKEGWGRRGGRGKRGGDVCVASLPHLYRKTNKED